MQPRGQVMDYSILVGIDEERGDILIGIIDYVRGRVYVCVAARLVGLLTWNATCSQIHRYDLAKEWEFRVKKLTQTDPTVQNPERYVACARWNNAGGRPGANCSWLRGAWCASYATRLREAMDKYFATIPGKFTLIEEQQPVAYGVQGPSADGGATGGQDGAQERPATAAPAAGGDAGLPQEHAANVAANGEAKK